MKMLFMNGTTTQIVKLQYVQVLRGLAALLIHQSAIMFCYKITDALVAKFSISPSMMLTNLVFVGTALVALGSGVVLHLFVEKPLLAVLNRERTVSTGRLKIVRKSPL